MLNKKSPRSVNIGRCTIRTCITLYSIFFAQFLRVYLIVPFHLDQFQNHKIHELLKFCNHYKRRLWSKRLSHIISVFHRESGLIRKFYHLSQIYLKSHNFFKKTRFNFLSSRLWSILRSRLMVLNRVSTLRLILLVLICLLLVIYLDINDNIRSWSFSLWWVVSMSLRSVYMDVVLRLLVMDRTSPLWSWACWTAAATATTL